MKEVAAAAELVAELAKSRRSKKIIVVDFYGVNCPACHTSEPFVEALSRKYASASVFLKIDIEQLEDVARLYKVSAMPTFVFFDNAIEAARIVGADIAKLRETMEKLTAGKVARGGGTTVPFTGEGRRLGGPSPSPAPQPAAAESAPSTSTETS
ncbi:thioredoxin-like protein [Ramicandelaber brevisporus]|nr:thioredoxin-like protein [Ramicandelaber brevisporus]